MNIRQSPLVSFTFGLLLLWSGGLVSRGHVLLTWYYLETILVGAVIAIWRNPVNHSIYAITTFMQFRTDSLKRTQLTRRSPPLNDSMDTGWLVTTSCLSIWNSFWYGYRVCVVIRWVILRLPHRCAWRIGPTSASDGSRYLPRSTSRKTPELNR